ncbi:hypothetical protein Acr_01g0005740 [Actinidia rufa]|uniref:Uncharacterized protein n=1 Tax=Actinidia rufa TaxID=165716 RepID=A0A7J0E2M9_9ERIC|nr:hypothetical protein Acr_01g0005740 [Actinidia rufa]
MSSTSQSGAIRGNFSMQVTFCPLSCLRITADHCPLDKPWHGYPVELAIERQLNSDTCLSLDSVIFRLEVFGVAHNNLSGATPDKAQFLTFEESSYEGNSLICGPPLHNSCTETLPTSTMQEDKDEEGDGSGFMDMESLM